MIITLAKANFSANNIGALYNYSILTNLDTGLIYNGPTNISGKNELIATLTLQESYILDSINIFMDDVLMENVYTISDNIITITIPSVTGVVVINAMTSEIIIPEEPEIPEVASYWITEQLVDTKVGSGAATSMLNTQYFFIDDEAYVAALQGKTIEAIAITRANKVVSGAQLILALVPIDNTLPTAWEEQISIPFSSDEISTIMTLDLETPFTVPAGYTLGYRSTKGNVFGGGTVNGSYKRSDKYYNNNTAETFSPISMAPIDCKVRP